MKLTRWGLGSLSETAELLISELVTNAVKAVGGLDDMTAEMYEQTPLSISGHEATALGNVRLRLSSDRTTVVIEVWDKNDDPPVAKEPDLSSESGRGLFLVTCMAKQWGYYFPPEGGKVVWCEITET